MKPTEPKKILCSLAGILILFSCGSYSNMENVSTVAKYSPLDYSNLDYWASHPMKEDKADLIPRDVKANSSISDKPLVDIFFVHPTTYTKRNKAGSWNADINDDKLNNQTDNSTIQFQASIFNQVGRIYAPRYRQAYIGSFYTSDTIGSSALAYAYEDVAASFEYYLKNFRGDRPFIIASHSQGTVHTTKLIREYIDGQSLQKDFIIAYLIGMPIHRKSFENISVCNSPSETNCFISWRTYQAGYSPDNNSLGESIAVVNPLSWNTNKQKVGKEYHQGAILRNFNKRFDQIIEARIHNGMLWTNKPKFPWSFLFNRKNYHIADMNFFYFDIQQNATFRANQFMKERAESGKY